MTPTSENRIDRKFRELKARGQRAFVAYVTAGDPGPEATPGRGWARERAGADIVELGVPFSDPLADGIVNQLSAQRALEAGTTTSRVFEILQAAHCKRPTVSKFRDREHAITIEKYCRSARWFPVDRPGTIVGDYHHHAGLIRTGPSQDSAGRGSGFALARPVRS